MIWLMLLVGFVIGFVVACFVCYGGSARGYFTIEWIDEDSYSVNMRVPNPNDQSIHTKRKIIMCRENSQQ